MGAQAAMQVCPEGGLKSAFAVEIKAEARPGLQESAIVKLLLGKPIIRRGPIQDYRYTDIYPSHEVASICVRVYELAFSGWPPYRHLRSMALHIRRNDEAESELLKSYAVTLRNTVRMRRFYEAAKGGHISRRTLPGFITRANSIYVPLLERCGGLGESISNLSGCTGWPDPLVLIPLYAGEYSSSLHSVVS